MPQTHVELYDSFFHYRKQYAHKRIKANSFCTRIHTHTYARTHIHNI